MKTTYFSISACLKGIKVKDVLSFNARQIFEEKSEIKNEITLVWEKKYVI